MSSATPEFLFVRPGDYVAIKKEFRNNGYGVRLWKHALEYLKNVECIGLEAAPDRLNDYAKWGFRKSSITNRWKLNGFQDLPLRNFYKDQFHSFKVVPGNKISSEAVLIYDDQREPRPRPHFLHDWLKNSHGNVSAIVDNNGMCHGFGRIRPCVLEELEIQIHGPCFKLPILTMERSL